MKTLLVLAVLGGWQTQYQNQTQYYRQCNGNGCSLVPYSVQVPVQVWVPDIAPAAKAVEQKKPEPSALPPAPVVPPPPALEEQPKPTLFRFY